jgi:two-component system sensor histidine kinase AlgZ
VLLCALRRRLRRLPPTRARAVLGLGAAAALAAWWPLWLAGPGRSMVAACAPGQCRWPAPALAALLWAWLELRARIWQPATASARLAELQSRIRPHFLFNALNTALALVRVDPARAEAVLEDLAELFRVALAEAGSLGVAGEEIALARRYLAIEQVRFGDRLRVQLGARPAPTAPACRRWCCSRWWRTRCATASSRRWAAGASASRPWRSAAGRADGAQHPARGPAPGNGMALHNVRERLRLLHDVAASVEATPGATCDGFHARIT